MAISKGNSKIGKTPNISLIPVKDCANCKLCAKSCYALKAWKQYPNVRNSWGWNSYLAHTEPARYWNHLRRYLEMHKTQYFRFHVAGDILDQEYLNSMKAIACEFPGTQFLCFTKRIDLDFAGLPANLKIGLSRWPKDGKVNRIPGVRFAWLQDGTETRIPEGAFECKGKCDDCRFCYDKEGDVYFHIH